MGELCVLPFLQVLIQFYHLVGDCELPVLEMGVLGLGTEVEIRTFDLKANAFLKEFWLKCPEYLGKTIKRYINYFHNLITCYRIFCSLDFESIF